MLGKGIREQILKYNSPSAGSEVVREKKESLRPESIQTACSIALLQIEYGGEHLAAFGKTLYEPLSPLVAWTCVRSMLESSAIAAWMVDPKIDHKERVARQFAFRYSGFEQQIKFAKVAMFENEKVSGIVSHVDHMEDIALKLGYSKNTNSNGKRIGVARLMPNATEIISQMLAEESMYRLLSAVAHGHMWAHISLAYKTASQPLHQGDSDGQVREHNMEKQVSIVGMFYLGIGAAKAFSLPVWYYFKYMGWDLDQLIILFEQVFEKLYADEKSKFWRQSG